MTKANRASAAQPRRPAPLHAVVPAPPTPRVASLERRRLQSYIALILADLTALVVGFGLAGFLYLGSAGLARAGVLAQLVTPVFLTAALYNGAYSMTALGSARQGGLRAVGALAMSAATVIFIAFYAKASEDFSRVLFSAGVLLSGALLVWERLQMRAFVRWRCGSRVINEVLIEDGGPVLELPGATRVNARAHSLVPAPDDPHALDRFGLVVDGADRVIVSCPPERRAAWTAILRGANVSGEVLDDVVAELSAHGARIAEGHGFLRVSVGPLGLRARATKRLFDTSAAIAGLVLLSPLLLLVAVLILLEDGGPVLFIQRRVGRGNRFFDMMKFRSMGVDLGDREGARSANRTDDRVTRVGRFIRRTSIDELPQLYNVLLGQMSIVGPRPHALGSQAGNKPFWEVDERYSRRHVLKPGMTGLAQVRGLRGATDQESDLTHRLNADLEYVDGWSLWRDIAIIIQTARVLVHDRAY